MKNSIQRILTVVIIATMMLSTVAMAAEGKVNVYEEIPTINGLNDDPKGTAGDWEALDLSSKTPDSVRDASEVLNMSATGTEKQAMVVAGYIIPKETKTGFSFRHDDGLKVFINDRDGATVASKSNWKLTGEVQMDFTETLEVNKVYPFRIEYFDWGGTEVLTTDLPMSWFHDSIPSYTVRYFDGDSEFDSKEVAHGLEAADIPGPSKEGFVFDGWLLEGSPYVFTTPVLGDLDLTASWVDDYNLWVSVDDAAEHVYVNGQKVLVTPDISTGNNWDTVSKTFVYNVGNNPLVAAKASDTGNVIVGFNLVLESANGSYVETNDDEWYYYYNPTVNEGVPPSFDGLEWYDVDYAAIGWNRVSAVPPHNSWVSDDAFPAGALRNEWIWSSNYLPDIDTPVYLRSAEPKAIYNVSFDTLGGSPIPAAYDVASGTVIGAPTEVPFIEGYDFDGWDYDFSQPITGTTVIKAKYVELPFDVEIDPTIYELMSRDPDVVEVNKDAGFVRASAEGLDPTTSNDTVIEAELFDGTVITLEAVPAEGFTFYKWKYNIVNPDAPLREQSREVVVTQNGQRFSPTPVFVAVEPEPVNLWIAADDHADVYVNGVKTYDVDRNWNDPAEFFLEVKSVPFFAVKAWDTDGQANIAGFRLEFDGEAGEEATGTDWYVYNVFNEDGFGVEPPANADGTEWTSENYVGDENWIPASLAIEGKNWAKDGDFPAEVTSAWIWSALNDVPNDAGHIESPVYLRSKPVIIEEKPEDNPDPVTPRVLTVEYDLTVETTEGGTVTGFLGTNSFPSGTNVNLEPVAEDGYVFAGWTGEVVDGVVVVNADKTVVANFELIVEDEVAPQATPDEDTDEILDEEITEAAPEIPDEPLPQTGGVPASMMSMFGIAMTGLGFKIRKRK